MSTKSWNKTISIAHNENIYVTANGAEIGTFSKGIVSVINSKQNIKSKPNHTIQRSGRTLKIILPLNQISPTSQIALFNLAGKRQNIKPVFHANGITTISLSNLTAGLYILRISDGKKIKQSRIVLK